MIIQHLLLFVCLCFIIGRKPKPNYRKRSRAYEAAYRKREHKVLPADTTHIAWPDTAYRLQLAQ